MSTWFMSYRKLFVASLLVLSVFLVGAGAQKKKKRTRRTSKPAAAKPVINNPEIAPPTTTDASGDVKIISTADQAEGEATEKTQSKKPKTAVTASPTSEQEMQQTISTLSNQVNKLTDKLTEMQEDDRYQIDMERLTRAEQRAEQIRSQLIDTQTKIADLESKLEQVEWSLKPENIDRVAQGMGTLRPEEVRDTKRRQLENERTRLQAQLKILETSKSRLETSSVNADAEVDALRTKLEQRRQQMDADTTPVPPKKPQP